MGREQDRVGEGQRFRWGCTFAVGPSARVLERLGVGEDHHQRGDHQGGQNVAHFWGCREQNVSCSMSDFTEIFRFQTIIRF